jgi:hypothetical protein
MSRMPRVLPASTDGALSARHNSSATQRDASASMSFCIERLNSSDHAAPGFWLSLLGGRGAAVWVSAEGFRGVVFSFRTGRGLAEFGSLIR